MDVLGAWEDWLLMYPPPVQALVVSGKADEEATVYRLVLD